MELLIQFSIGFVIALSGALIPGPLLVAVIRSTLKNGKKTGFFTSMGHITVEICIIFGVILGISTFILSESIQSYIGTVGGLLLIIFGIITFQESKKITQFQIEESGAISGGITTGVTFTLFNPTFPFWWATIGFAMLSNAYYTSSFLGTIFWILGHFFADILWFSSVSIMISQNKSIIGKKPHKYLIIACAISMIIIGILFLGKYLF